MWDEITYPFPNFNGATVDVWEWDKQFHFTLYNICNYLSMLGLKLIHVSQRDPRTSAAMVLTKQSKLVPVFQEEEFALYPYDKLNYIN